MKTISLIAAGMLALGWGTGRAEISPSGATADPPADSATTPPPLTNAEVSPAAPVAPGGETPPGPATSVEVDTPPGANVDVNVNPTVIAPPVEPQPVSLPDDERGHVYRSSVSPSGGGLFIGGGFEDFTDNNLRRMTGGAGTWSARIVGGMRRVVGVEAAYVGSARNIDALGLDPNARLLSNGVEGALRLNIPIVRRNQMLLVEPFGFAGLGWAHYNVVNTNLNVSDVASKDDIMTVPLGAGLTFGYGAFMAEARFTYRKTYNNDLVAGQNLDSWGGGAQIGFGF